MSQFISGFLSNLQTVNFGFSHCARKEAAGNISVHDIGVKSERSITFYSRFNTFTVCFHLNFLCGPSSTHCMGTFGKEASLMEQWPWRRNVHSNLDLPPACIDLLISSLRAHLSCSSFRDRIRKANTAVVQLSAARQLAHSFQLWPPSHGALKMEQIDFWIDKLF